MDECARLFYEITGRPLVKRAVDYRSAGEIDEGLFEAVSRLFYEDRVAFYYLKKLFARASREGNGALILSAAGYFHYVDCEFPEAARCFQEAIALNPGDIESWFCLAFCYRQAGDEARFNGIILNHTRMIRELLRGKNAKGE